MSPPAAEIFVSYRRLDSAIFSQWLANQLRTAYGPNCVFIDTESIREAEVWASKIRGALEAARVVIAVIGKRWLSIKDEFERRRIDDPNDWVRRELEVGFELGKTVVPVLIEDAQIPVRAALPPSVARLVDLQARVITAENIAADISAFVSDIGERLGKRPPTVPVSYPFPLLRVKALDAENLSRLALRLPDWRVATRMGDDGKQRTELVRSYEFESFEDAIHFMNTAIRFIARIDHHPDWTNIWRTVIVRLTTWDIGHQPSMLDVDLAAYLDELYGGNYVRRLSKGELDATAGMS